MYASALLAWFLLQVGIRWGKPPARKELARGPAQKMRATSFSCMHYGNALGVVTTPVCICLHKFTVQVTV